MARFKKLPINTNEGKLVFGDNIVDGIVLLAVKEIPFVQLATDSGKGKMRSYDIKCVKTLEGIRVDVAVKVHFSQSISEIAFRIQESVRHNVEAMTEYHIANVNVIIKGVFFDTEEKKTSNKDSNPKCCKEKKDRAKYRVKNVNVFIKDALVDEAINNNVAVTEEKIKNNENK